MLRKVYLEGELGQKFISSFTVEAKTLQDVVRCADVNFSGFKKHLMDCHENDIGFIIDVADIKVEEDMQLLLPIKSGDITITPVPAGSKGMGKILAAMAILAVVVMAPYAMGMVTVQTAGMGTAAISGSLTTGSFASAVSASSLGGAVAAGFAASGTMGLLAAGLAINLAMTGISEMMAPDPATDGDQESSYMFNGAEQNVIEGDPVPVLYGNLRIPGQPISFDAITGQKQRQRNIGWMTPEQEINNNPTTVDAA